MAVAPRPKPKPKPAPVNPYATNPAGFSQVQQILNQFGLGSLAPWALNQMRHGATADDVSLGIRRTQQWEQRFWMITARQKAGLPPISETDVINYEDTAAQLANKYGLPAGFLTQHVAGEWLAADKSPAELDNVLNNGYNQVANAPPQVIAAFDQMFGVNQGKGALAAYFTDPTKAEPLLLQQAQAAQFKGNATRYGIDLSNTDSMTLAQANVTQDRAQTGFQDIDKLSALFQTQVGDTKSLDKAQGVEAHILGNAQMLDTEQQKLASRVAGAKGKVGVEENPEKGFVGLGEGF